MCNSVSDLNTLNQIIDHLEQALGKPQHDLASVQPTSEEKIPGPHGQSSTSRSKDLLDELVGTILSQNTSDRNSSRAFRSLKQAFPNWEAVADAEPEALIESIRSGGLANIKARRIQAILWEIQAQQGKISLQFLLEKTNDRVIEYLTSLNGVGPKTAACVLLFGMARDICPVDTHVHRISNRLGLVHTRHADQTFQQLRHQIPEGRAYSFHVCLIRLGKRICKSRAPHCHRCPLQQICPSAHSSEFKS